VCPHCTLIISPPHTSTQAGFAFSADGTTHSLADGTLHLVNTGTITPGTDGAGGYDALALQWAVAAGGKPVWESKFKAS
jgi:hypothetical protein